MPNRTSLAVGALALFIGVSGILSTGPEKYYFGFLENDEKVNISEIEKKAYQKGYNKAMDKANDRYENEIDKVSEERFHEGWSRAENLYREEFPYNRSGHITFLGKIESERFTFIFRDNISYSKDTRGLANTNNNTVVIESGYRVRTIVDTCNHELLHLHFPEFSHSDVPKINDPLYIIDEDVKMPICSKVIAKAQKYQGGAEEKETITFSRNSNYTITDVETRKD